MKQYSYLKNGFRRYFTETESKLIDAWVDCRTGLVLQQQSDCCDRYCIIIRSFRGDYWKISTPEIQGVAPRIIPVGDIPTTGDVERVYMDLPDPAHHPLPEYCCAGLQLV